MRGGDNERIRRATCMKEKAGDKNEKISHVQK